MSNENKGCLPFIAIAVVVLIIGFVCNHVAEQSKKLDSFSNFFIGAIIVGLIFIAYYFYDKGKHK